MTDRLQALLDADQDCSRVLCDLANKHGTHRVQCSEDEWNAISSAFDARDAAREALMPTEQDAIRLLFEAYTRLKDLGWNNPIYCPKDGSAFDVIEPGSTGIHSCAYWGEWPDGGWWIDGDSPSRPILYRVTEAEIAKRDELRAAFRASRDSDGNPEGEKPQALSAKHDSAGPEGIAETQSQ